MYKELDKYKTGKRVEWSIGDKTETTKYYKDGYNAPLGDLINDFIEHKNKPRRKRKTYHAHLTKLYKTMLNSRSVNCSL